MVMVRITQVFHTLILRTQYALVIGRTGLHTNKSVYLQDKLNSIPRQISRLCKLQESMVRSSFTLHDIPDIEASSFYGLKSYEMEQVLPRRPFYHDGIYGNAYEHRAVRRMAYIRVAYLSGFYGDEAFQYHNGRCTLNQK